MPLGLYSHHLASKAERPGYKPLALVPFFFGVQQFVEGLEWTGIVGGKIEPLTSMAGLGFLFFAYCFWMIWIHGVPGLSVERQTPLGYKDV